VGPGEDSVSAQVGLLWRGLESVVEGYRAFAGQRTTAALDYKDSIGEPGVNSI